MLSMFNLSGNKDRPGNLNDLHPRVPLKTNTGLHRNLTFLAQMEIVRTVFRRSNIQPKGSQRFIFLRKKKKLLLLNVINCCGQSGVF